MSPKEKLIAALCVTALALALGLLAADVIGGREEFRTAQVIDRMYQESRTRHQWVGTAGKGGHMQTTTEPEKWLLVLKEDGEDPRSVQVSASEWAGCAPGKFIQLRVSLGRWTGWRYGSSVAPSPELEP